jgi:hypothetical protein
VMKLPKASLVSIDTASSDSLWDVLALTELSSSSLSLKRSFSISLASEAYSVSP